MMLLQDKYQNRFQGLNSPRGYTLGEVIIVLLVWSIFIICLVPIHHQVIQKIQTNHYISQFKDDVLFTQQMTMQNHSYYWLMIRPESNDYLLYDSKNKKTIFHREFPSNWRVEMLTLDTRIRFNTNGTIKNPGTMNLHTFDHTFEVIFPFGISRVKINEQ